MTIESYIGLAPDRARGMANLIMKKFPQRLPEGDVSPDDAPIEDEVPPEGGG